MTVPRTAESAAGRRPVALHGGSAAVDPDAGSRPPRHAGFGACARSGCRCQHYQGLAGHCANEGCRHSIGDHW